MVLGGRRRGRMDGAAACPQRPCLDRPVLRPVHRPLATDGRSRSLGHLPGLDPGDTRRDLGTGLERLLIGLAVLVAVSSTLALIITVRTGLSLMVTASLAAGCGSTSSSSQRPATPTPRPVSCRQQYQAWKRGPALAGDKMQAAVNAVQAAEQSGNVTAISSALSKLVPEAVAAAQAPPPRCADPDGLFSDYVTAVYVAGDNARTAKGISGLLKAAAPLKGLKTIESKLAAEAARAMAKNQ